LHRRLQNSGAIAHTEARAIASKPWSKDGSESRGQAGVTGPPGNANPLCPCTLHALVAVRTSADASTVWEGGLAYLSKNHQPNRPACRRPRSACIPCSRCPELIVAPGAWMWSVICALVQGFSKDLREESHSRFLVITGDSPPTGQWSLLLFCVVCCSLVLPHPTPSPHPPPPSPHYLQV
jgi:hypothetical protein